MDNETPDQIPEYLLILDNDSWYADIFTASVIDDPLMTVAALNLPAPKRERRAPAATVAVASATTTPVAPAMPVVAKTAAVTSAAQPPMSITRWL